MKADAAPRSALPVAAGAREGDVAYYTRRVVEERRMAVTAASDVARAAHRMLALIYEDHLRDLNRRAAGRIARR